jgi:hypothetical protein
MERLDHLKGNQVTKDDLHKKILQMQQIYMDKFHESQARYKAQYNNVNW